MARRTAVIAAVLAVVIAATASAAAGGLYTGKTSQSLKISLKVSKGKVTKVSYTARYGSCGEFIGADKTDIAIKKGKFSATVHPNSETVDKISGNFKGQKVTGTLNSTVTTGGIHPTTCHSGKLTFSAKH